MVGLDNAALGGLDEVADVGRRGDEEEEGKDEEEEEELNAVGREDKEVRVLRDECKI